MDNNNNNDNNNKIIITIDARETAMYNDIIDRDLDNYKERVQIISENLLLGDIHITYGSITHIFERKTLQDLQASIIDGRYKEQKARLLSTTPQKYITYIIEGDNILSQSSYSKNKSMIQSAYLHTLFRDNIRIIYTKNIEETTTLILLISTKILDKPDKFLYEEYTADKCYTDFVKLKKKKIDNIDTKACFIMQLSQIPMISNVIAKNIYAKYTSMGNLVKSLDVFDTPELKVKELCKIDGVGKEKALSIVKNIFSEI
jgi:crossover junction endonuclease MUS81